MDISILAVKLIFMFIPGMLATRIYYKLTVKHKPEGQFKYFSNALLLGVLSYLIVGVWYKACGCEMTFWSSLNEEGEIPFSEIGYASICAIGIGVTVSLFETYKVFNKIVQWLGISYKYGDENLYSYYLNSKEIVRVYIRDLSSNHTYHGSVAAFSENENYSEIVLDDVTVYSYEESCELYRLKSIYLSRPKNLLIIELPHENDITDGKEEEL